MGGGILDNIITKEMIADFNSNYLFGKSSIRLYLVDEKYIQISVDDIYLTNAPQRMTAAFYDLLENYFRDKHDIDKIAYDNCMTTFRGWR